MGECAINVATLAPDLAELMAAWPELPAETRAAILAIARGKRPKPVG